MVTGVRSDENGLLANGRIVQRGGWPAVKVEPMIEKEKMVHCTLSTPTQIPDPIFLFFPQPGMRAK
jgi:hypothetical protein